MRKTIFTLIATSVLLAPSTEAGEFRRDIPKGTWEPIFFRYIDDVTQKAGLEPLRKRAVPAGSMEIRIWMGFGLTPLGGYIIRRDGTAWSGKAVQGRPGAKSLVAKAVTPKSGWEKFWSKLEKLEVLTLPDSSTLPDEVSTLDGIAYVVEINKDDLYRTYEYSNPQDQKWAQAKTIRRIAELFHAEFAPK